MRSAEKLREYNQQLFYAAAKGDFDAAAKYIELGADVNSVHIENATALHIAVKNNHLNIVKLLLSKNANTEARVVEGDTALYIAAVQGNAAITTALLEAGADKEAVIKNYTSLFAAVYFGKYEVVKILLDAGADLYLDNLSVVSVVRAAADVRNKSAENDRIYKLVMEKYWNNIVHFNGNGSFEVVVARYNEDLSWIAKEFPTEKVTVYNKGLDDLVLPKNCRVIKLPNIGRESNSYLHHVITNYDNLSDRILFLQGDPYGHQVHMPLNKYKIFSVTSCKNIVGICISDSLENQSKILSATDWSSSKWDDIVVKNESLVDYANNYLDKSYDKEEIIYFQYGAQFAIDRDKILCRSIGDHRKINNTLAAKHPIEVHYIERLWDEWANCNGDLSLWDKAYQHMSIKESYKVVFIYSQGGENNYAEHFKYSAEIIGWQVRLYPFEINPHSDEILAFDPDFILFSILATRNINSQLLLHRSKKYFHNHSLMKFHLTMGTILPSDILPNQTLSIQAKNYLIPFDGIINLEGDIESFKIIISKMNRPFFGIDSSPLAPALINKAVEPQNLMWVGMGWDKFRSSERFKDFINRLSEDVPMRIYGSQEAFSFLRQDAYAGFTDAGMPHIEAIRESGIYLLTHTDIYIDEAVPTGRVFEAVAANVVVISDMHPFVIETFGDNMLYFDQNADSETMYLQVKSHYDWIKANPEKAKEMANNAHQIFLAKFTIEHTLPRIAKMHEYIVENDQSVNVEMLSRALITESANSNLEQMEQLLLKGAEVNYQDPNMQNVTALYIAVESGNLAAAEMLLQHFANTELRITSQVTPLHRAVQDNNLQMLELLLRYNAKVNVYNSKAYSALAIAVYQGYEQVVKALINHGADVNDLMPNGRNLLQIAAERKFAAIFALLAEKSSFSYSITAVGIDEIAFTSRVKNEEDIIFENLVWHFMLGFRKFFLIDNLSTDKTLAIIDDFAKLTKDHAKVFIIKDPIYEHIHGQVMTGSYHFIREVWPEVKWIFPVDADEFLAPTRPLKSELAKIDQDIDAIDLYAYEYYPGPDYSYFANDSKFYNKMHYRHYQIDHGKIAAKAQNYISITHGNHAIEVNPTYNIDKALKFIPGSYLGLSIYEFQLRSAEHAHRKCNNGMQASAKAKEQGLIKQDANMHWHKYADFVEKYGDKAGEARFNETFIDLSYTIDDSLPIGQVIDKFYEIVAT